MLLDLAHPWRLLGISMGSSQKMQPVLRSTTDAFTFWRERQAMAFLGWFHRSWHFQRRSSHPPSSHEITPSAKRPSIERQSRIPLHDCSFQLPPRMYPTLQFRPRQAWLAHLRCSDAALRPFASLRYYRRKVLCCSCWHLATLPDHRGNSATWSFLWNSRERRHVWPALEWPFRCQSHPVAAQWPP